MLKKLNPSLVKILSMLSDGAHHDGDSLGAALGMTRSAVWKVIKKLQDYGVGIESVKGKGYVLLEPARLLDETAIKKNLINKKIKLDIFETIPSTKEYLKKIKSSVNPHVCLAEHQTEAQGRFGRAWHAPFGKNIYFSCLYSFQKDISELAGLSLVVSLAVLKAIKLDGLHENIFVKWPNDILCDGKKLAGILIEIQAETHGMCHAIISVGMNVNMMNADKQITQAWTSIQKELNRYVDRSALCAEIINQVLDYMRRFEAAGLSVFVDEWIQADYLTHKEIAVKNLNHDVRGIVRGINAQGHLLLQLQNGEMRAFSSGDTTVVKERL